jgi:DMSO/TMAO reductase YedYZ molybdopterin-dependent catalytic subunit
MKPRLLITSLILSIILIFFSVSCQKDDSSISATKSTENIESNSQETNNEVSSEEEPYPGYSAIKEMFAEEAERAKEYAPKVVTLESGVQIQRTPDEDYASVYHTPGVSISYNTYYLDSDNRGCNSCHGDLNTLLNNMVFDHVNLDNYMGIETTVSQCIDCHSYSPGYVTENYGFGTLIHGIHKSDHFNGECMSCHTATGNGEGMALWDLEKHNLFRGIKDVSNVQGDFSYIQDNTLTDEETFAYNWMYYDSDYERYGAEMAGVPEDPKVFDDWEISVSGHVENPFTIKLVDLIEEAPVVTTTMVMHCTMNPMGGSLIANCEITGVPVKYLLEKAGIKEDATVMSPIAIDGFSIPVSMEHLDAHESYLVYEINGNRLRHALGYPVQLWNGSFSAASYVKQINEIKIEKDSVSNYHMHLGWDREDGGFYNKPNVGLCNIQEGQIIEANKPFQFEGYADAFEQEITSIEFSMDRGRTWTAYDTTGSDTDRWLYWNFTFTPEDVGAYVLKIRGRTETGMVSDEPVEVMVNAK